MMMTEKAGAEVPRPELKSIEPKFMGALSQQAEESRTKGPERFLANTGLEPGQAFNSKFTVHAGTVGQTMFGLEARSTFENLLSTLEYGPLGIYLHIPFCQNRCLYCGFVGQKPENDLIEQYASAVIKEIEYVSSKIPGQLGPVRTIYFGGGTPTILSPKLLASLTGAIQKNFDLANDFEMTLEGRVSDLTPEKIQGFFEAGFNRFSLGLQSFDTKIRQSLGRHSSGPKAISFLSDLIKWQKAAVIIDLIYGLPGQDVATFLKDLETANLIGVDGLDTYQLNTFSGGEMEKAIQNGRLLPQAPLAAQAEYYLKAAEYLDRLKWRRLSISHYARDTRERNIYNPWAKSRKNCLPFGAGAGGFISGHSSYRQPDVKAYLESAKTEQFGPDFLTAPTGNESLQALIVSQMELGYLNLKKLYEEEGVDPKPISILTANWREAGLIQLNGNYLELTDPGRFWGVNLTQALVITASEART
ncbi:MAG: heme anaerobic degradation radical SAM methyltransferase ChuW/HutW, partial [Deltaproteobacteria bacterium]|nr:heme anaerobic degradation radical SAM methyltransferase ChuW/HutW [Deltaproteobacteria bacterium]